MEIIFNDEEGREPWVVPTNTELAEFKRDDLRENCVLLSYALQHGSGANVKLAFPFTHSFAHMIAADNGKTDPVTLLREIEEEGRDANYGTVTVRV